MRIALHVPGPAEHARVVAILCRRGIQVSSYAEGNALCAAVAAGAPPDAILMALRDAHGRSLMPLVQRLRARCPGVPIVVYATISPCVARDLMDAARLGVVEAVLHGDDDLVAVLHRVVSATAACRLADAALAAVRTPLAPAVVPVVLYCLAHAQAVPSVAEIAAAFNVSRKTIAARLAAEGLPPASALVSWGRVLLAARWLEDARCPVERAALALGFDSGTGLRHMIARRTGLSSSEIRSRGGLAAVLPLFAVALEGSRCKEGKSTAR